jgi:hypothetical protein
MSRQGRNVLSKAPLFTPVAPLGKGLGAAVRPRGDRKCSSHVICHLAPLTHERLQHVQFLVEKTFGNGPCSRHRPMESLAELLLHMLAYASVVPVVQFRADADGRSGNHLFEWSGLDQALPGSGAPGCTR